MKINLNSRRCRQCGLVWLLVFVAIAVTVVIIGGCEAAKKAQSIRVHQEPEFTNDFIQALDNAVYQGDPKAGKLVALPDLRFEPFYAEGTNLAVRIQSSTNLVDWVDEEMSEEDVFYLLSNPSARTSPMMFFRGVVAIQN